MSVLGARKSTSQEDRVSTASEPSLTSETDVASGGDGTANVSWGGWRDLVDTELWPSGDHPSKKQPLVDNMTVVENKNWFEEAVNVVKDKDYRPQSMFNQVVADELLRAKTWRPSSSPSYAGGHEVPQSLRSFSLEKALPIGGVDVVRALGDVAMAANPGSVGHPNLCRRPCMYEAAGECNNGQNCDFCHMPHPKRSVRLNKRHRNNLKDLPLDELLEIMLPILRRKALEINNKEIEKLLDRLSACAQTSSRNLAGCASMSMRSGVSSCSSSRGSTKSESFSGALGSMTMRMILAMLARFAGPEGTAVGEIVAELLSSHAELCKPVAAHGARSQGSCTTSEGRSADVV